MNKLIPLHCLVLLIGNSKQKKDQLAEKYFENYELVREEDIFYELCGEDHRNELNELVLAEIKHRIQTKLNIGERCVVDFSSNKEERLGLARLAVQHGVPVFYLLAEENDRDQTDRMGDVVFCEKCQLTIVKKSKTFNEIRDQWAGITVIPDIHGMMQPLLAALSWARSRNHYVIFLGDCIDYGADSLQVADEVYRVITRGEGEFLLGNHERKIFRWLANIKTKSNMHLSEGNRVTIRALDELNAQSRLKWTTRFRALVHLAFPYRNLSNFVFAHAAIHEFMWPLIETKMPFEISNTMMNWCLFGEYIPHQEYKNTVKQYRWTSAVPPAQTVIVGHDIRSLHQPVVVTNGQKGQTIFLDNGSGKGGVLTSCDLKFFKDGLKIENYNTY